MTADRELLTEHIDDAERYLEDGITLTRQLTVDLSPQTLDSADLGEAVRWLVEEMREMHELEVTVHAPERVLVADRDRRALIYQALRELLFNIVKHAGTRRAEVTIETDELGLSVLVTDDGVGFDVGARSESSHAGRGLVDLRERFELVAGTLDVESVPGDGTRVLVRCPAERHAARDAHRNEGRRGGG